MQRLSLEKLPYWLDSSFRYFEAHERHIDRRFYTTNVLLLVFDGVLRFEENGVPVEVHAGEYYVQKHGYMQTGRVESDSPKYYWIHFHVAVFDEAENGLALRGKFDTAEILPYLRQMETFRMMHEPAVKIAALFYTVLGKLQEHNAVKDGNAVVSAVISALATDIRKPFSLEELSEQCGYSKNHIISIFKREIGKTPLVYITEMKIEMAKQLMLNSNSSLSSISIECGFGSYINFYRSFTKAVGIPPAEWKKQHCTLQISN